MTQFSDLGLAEPILHAINGEGYTSATPIQARVIPAMIAGRDILGIAQTGTGKTAAFVLPVLHALAAEKVAHPKERVERRAKTCKTLIVVPTRELAQQIAIGVKTYGRHLRPNVAVIVGGASIGVQSKAMAQGVDVLVATPGRLEDHMRSGSVKLGATSCVVLDEADQMLDMGFIPAIRRILEAVSAVHQTVLLSATMPRPLAALAQDFLSDPEHISVAPQSKPIDRIEQSVVPVAAAAKRDLLLELLSPLDVERAIVFTRTKYGADKVAKYLGSYGMDCAVIHGNKTQGQRERALQGFRKGKMKVMVATDVAARGIDIDNVSHVINYELPNVPEAYVHRIGRTGRAGKSGVAISLCDPAERKHLKMIERLIKQSIPVTEMESVGDGTGSRNGDERSQDNKRGRRGDVKRRREQASGSETVRERGSKQVDGGKRKSRREERPARSAGRREDFGFDPLNPAEVEAQARKPRRSQRRLERAAIADSSSTGWASDKTDYQDKRAGKDKRASKADNSNSQQSAFAEERPKRIGKKNRTGGAGASARGDIKWFNTRKGYGFISQESGGPDVFVHISDMEKAGVSKPQEGQRFDYDVSEEKRGKLSAVNLRAA